MKITVKKEEHWPMYYEHDDEDDWYQLIEEIDVDPRVWEDYKMARTKFLKLHKKIENANNSNK